LISVDYLPHWRERKRPKVGGGKVIFLQLPPAK
jgi:hypothetical protein